MKKNDLILLISVAFYSWLFYQQALGVNFLIFSLVLIVLLLIRDKSLLKDNSWYVAACGSIVSGVCVMFYGSWLAFTANVISLSLLSALSVSRKSSVLLAGFYALYSYLSSIGFMIADFIERRAKKNSTTGSKFWIKLSVGIGIFAVIVLFFFLYQQSNPLFKDLTRKINLDFISWPWVRFTFLGFIILYGFFYSRNVPLFYRWDINIPKNLDAAIIQEKGNVFFGRKLNENIERISGIVLLALLNVLLFIVNILDVIYLWISRSLPEGMTLAESLHQGTGTLIVSVVLAIIIILFYFRGYINFSEKNKHIFWLAYLWIVQNVVVLISTAYRNYLYISEYSLTYRRLGVYVWLLLTIIGLITTFYKLYGKKTNLYLFKANSWSFYLVLVLFACFNWDVVITKFNIKNSKQLDKNYLVSLSSPANLPDLLALPTDEDDFFRQDYLDENINYDSRYYYDRYFNRGNFTAKLHKRLYKFLDSRKDLGWRSWNLASARTEKEILRLDGEGKISKLLLRKQNIENLEALQNLKNVIYLDVSENSITNFSPLQNMTNLKYLNAASNKLYTLDSMPVLKMLTDLNLQSNYINDFSKLKHFTKLENLNISSNSGIIDIEPLTELQNIKTLNLGGNEIKNIEKISKFNNLKSLTLSNMKNENTLKNLPVLPQLEELDISYNNFKLENIILLDKFREFKQLKSINLTDNNVKNLMILTTAKNPVFNFFFSWKTETDVEPVFLGLEKLILQSNKINNIEPLKYYPELKHLDLANNPLNSIETLALLKELNYLSLRNTKVLDYESLKELKKLETLDLSYNNLSDMSSLKCFWLKKLDLSLNQIVDIGFIEKFTELRELNLASNQISNIAPLTKLKHLEVLDLTGNPVLNYEILFSMKHLKELKISSISLEKYNELKANLPETKIFARQIYKDRK